MRALVSSLRMCLGLGFVVFSLTACQPPATVQERLLDAARDAGVEVRAQETFVLSSGEETVAIAPIAGWETVPASELANGVPVAFAYISSREVGVDEGFYTLRASADEIRLGTVDATVELVDRGDDVAGRIAAEAEIHATTVPARLPFETTFVTSRPDDLGRPTVWLRCPNGVCIRIPVLPRRPIGFPPINVEADSPRALRQASEAAGVRIDAEQTFSVFRPGSAIAAAPVTAWADQAASELRDGVDFAYAYLGSGELDVPPGYYTLRAFAEPTEPGLVQARVEIVDHHGEVVAETPAEVEVHSMRVPEQRPFPGTVIATLPGAEHLTLWFRCSNGQCIRLRLR